MFIDRGPKPLRRRSEERNCFSRAEGLVEFRSSERRWLGYFNSGYKHLTPPELKSLSCR